MNLGRFNQCLAWKQGHRNTVTKTRGPTEHRLGHRASCSQLPFPSLPLLPNPHAHAGPGMDPTAGANAVTEDQGHHMGYLLISNLGFLFTLFIFLPKIVPVWGLFQIWSNKGLGWYQCVLMENGLCLVFACGLLGEQVFPLCRFLWRRVPKSLGCSLQITPPQ